MKRGSSGPTQRQLRVGEQIRHVIAETLQRGSFRDEAIMNYASNISVSEVRISPDLKNATAYVVTLGNVDIEELLPGLNSEAHYFQKEINRSHNLKFTPKISFVKDNSFDEAKKINDILENITYSSENS
jgi:ribosome-binding factor A